MIFLTTDSFDSLCLREPYDYQQRIHLTRGWFYRTLNIILDVAMKVNITELILRLILTAIVFGVVLFLPAGTIAWTAGWAYLVLLFGFTIGISVWLARFNPELLEERMSGIGKPGQKGWDKVFLLVLLPVFFGWYVVIALDAVRFQWSYVPKWLQWFGARYIVGLVLYFLLDVS